MKKIEVSQTASYMDAHWWKWSVELKCPKEELDGIAYVEYTLHPTFPEPVQRVTNRHTNFRLNASGWGEFMIHVLVVYKNGRTKKLDHWLELKRPQDETVQTAGQKKSAPTKGSEPEPSEEERHRMFLSYGITDLPFAKTLARTLEEQGVEVVMTGDEDPDLPFEVSLRSSLNRVDSACFLISDRPSNLIMREFAACKERKLPITPVIMISHKKFDVPEEINEFSSLRIKNAPQGEIKKSAETVAKRLKSSFGFNATAHGKMS